MAKVAEDDTWEPWFNRHVGSGCLAVDVGANIGQHTGKMARTYQRVIAFEPLQWEREVLKKKMPENVEIRREAVWSHNDVIKFFKQSPGMLSGIYRIHPIKKLVGSPMRIQAVSIDSFGFTDLDLLKIDAEGAERQILSGARGTVERCLPRVMVEIHIPADVGFIRDYFKPLDYKLTEIPSPNLTFDAHWIIGYPPNRKEK